jgi:hypothetical protein
LHEAKQGESESKAHRIWQEGQLRAEGREGETRHKKGRLLLRTIRWADEKPH